MMSPLEPGTEQVGRRAQGSIKMHQMHHISSSRLHALLICGYSNMQLRSFSARWRGTRLASKRLRLLDIGGVCLANTKPFGGPMSALTRLRTFGLHTNPLWDGVSLGELGGPERRSEQPGRMPQLKSMSNSSWQHGPCECQTRSKKIGGQRNQILMDVRSCVSLWKRGWH